MSELKQAYLSSLAIARNADVFIWWGGSKDAEIIACFSHAMLTTNSPFITVQTLLHWIDCLATWGGALVLKSVKVEYKSCLHYAIKRADDNGVPLPDAHILTAGNYGCYYLNPHSAKRQPLAPLYKVVSLEQLEKQLNNPKSFKRKYYQGYLQYNYISDDARSGVLKRDSRCIFTGATHDPSGNPVGIDWIIPPALAHYLGNARTQDPELNIQISPSVYYTKQANMVPVRADIYKLWLASAFTVDVDDGYRIHIFDDKAQGVGLRDHLEAPDPAWDAYFGEHLRITLVVHLAHGDRAIEYNTVAIAHFKSTQVKLDRKSGLPVDLRNHAKWDSVIGKLILNDIKTVPVTPESIRVRGYQYVDEIVDLEDAEWEEEDDEEVEEVEEAEGAGDDKGSALGEEAVGEGGVDEGPAEDIVDEDLYEDSD
ncbi:uncharacterized protein TRAVEDRAFT_52058 [Trametes versicolor FP-101664 SS1]|uniref:uncharacterized protein n=1 Tax=Trametes versicolor (strain FP-101664) TaxID=717944 RepID=UPI000462156B|nr:uncharacterized protein TRAVEDRAFT_52058 [Trametes versicolor FP-101664 SS1]EIW54350.1 hypothetical protein TRAVEDRAFT_52058 [Trametes versicolor FP-101664 SS1]